MRYSFGECRLDTASRTLTRKNREIHLAPKAFDLLSLLIEQRPRVVRKADLMTALWPDTFVVEANLPVIVAELRTALGDKAAATSAIRTHHGIGYSFVGEVRELRSGVASSVDAPKLGLRVSHRKCILRAGANDIGRDEDSDIRINDASVSRSHARIVVRSDGAWLEDLDSKNGTWRKGARISKPVRLTDGDEIVFGVVKTKFLVLTATDRSTLTL